LAEKDNALAEKQKVLEISENQLANTTEKISEPSRSRSGKPWTAQEEKRLIKKKNAGMTVQQLSILLGRSEQANRKRLAII